MNKIHIFSYQTMLYFLCRSSFLAFLLPLLIKYKSDMIIVSILGSIISYILFSIIITMFYKQKKDNIIEKTDNINPKIIGKIINIIFALTFLYLSLILITKLGNFIKVEYLENTSIFLIYILIILTIVFLSHKDLETISKSSTILFFISICLFIFKCIILLKHIDFTYIMPLFTNKPLSIIKGSLLYAVFINVPTILLFLIPQNEIYPKKNVINKIKKMYAFILIVIFFHTFLILTVLGPSLSSIYIYPEFHLLTNVKVLGFLEKIEAIVSIIWLADFLLTISICLIYVKTTIIYYLKKLNPKFYNKINKYNYYNNN